MYEVVITPVVPRLSVARRVCSRFAAVYCQAPASVRNTYTNTIYAGKMGKFKYLLAALVAFALVIYQKNVIDTIVEPETMPEDVCWGAVSGKTKNRENAKEVRPFLINITTEVREIATFQYYYTL